MPCDSVQLNRVDLPRMNPAMRARALKAMGIELAHANQTTFTYNGHAYYVNAGNLASYTATDAEIQQAAAMLKRHYSAEVVKYTAQRNGWKVRQTGQFAYEVIK